MMPTKMLVVVMTIGVTACSAPAPAPGAPPAKTVDQAAPSATAPADGLFPGMGAHHHAMATTSAEAQRFFDQGMALVFGFNHEEAVRSFERAAALDPAAAMPHWGIAWAVGPNYNLDIDDPRARQAFAAVQAAQLLSAKGPEIERAYVAAMASRYSDQPGADRAALAQRYAGAMRDLVARYPDDLDAATLYAESLMNLRPWKLWSLEGQPAPDTLEIVSVLERVMARDPNHLGANHYYIHAIEASPSPQRGLASAQRFATLAPAAGHLSHMPAHIWARTGDHASAAAANRLGADADRAYFTRGGAADGFYAMAYYPHNLHFLADSEMMRGRFADAKRAADEVVERLAPHAAMMPMIESMMTMPVSVLLRFGRHAEILALPEPPADRAVLRAWHLFARGVALARSGGTADAVAARQAFGRAAADVPEGALFGGTGLESARSVLAVAASVLDARIARAEGRNAVAIARWRQAVAAADRIAYDEPPVWFYPLRESLGAALLLDGKEAEAEAVFRDDLLRHPRNPRSLFGLHQSLVRQQKIGDSAWVEQQFKAAWKDADAPPLTIEGL